MESMRVGPPWSVRLAVLNRVTRKTHDQSVFLVEMEPQGVVLEVPPSSFLQGHGAALRLVTDGLNPPISIEAEGKVTRQSLGSPERRATDDLDCIVVRFSKFDVESWERLMGAWRSRQAAIANALEAMKK